jgi:hypothetical protein
MMLVFVRRGHNGLSTVERSLRLPQGDKACGAENSKRYDAGPSRSRGKDARQGWMPSWRISGQGLVLPKSVAPGAWKTRMTSGTTTTIKGTCDFQQPTPISRNGMQFFLLGARIFAAASGHHRLTCRACGLGSEPSVCVLVFLFRA